MDDKKVEQIKALKVDVFDILQQEDIYKMRIQQLEELKVKKLQEINELSQEEKK
jgi:hypothetical protein